MSKILRIDMSDLSHKWESLKNDLNHYAGRSFNTHFASNEVDPICHLLLEKNQTGDENRFLPVQYGLTVWWSAFKGSWLHKGRSRC